MTAATSPPDLAASPVLSMGDQTPAHAPFLKGYRVTGRLGEGGMGVVWKAVQLSTHREVALKVMGAAGLGSSRARLRFEREVELSARLDHPGIAKVFDGGLDEGLCFYAMELVQGVALDQHVRDQKLSRRDILGLMQQVCRAVQHAHQKGIIHRDLKPSNVMITSEGLPKVLDFGLAKATEGDQAISLDGEVAGTPAYMSPEQAAGKLHALDTRSDVYTLGVILFHLLTGKFPHDTSGTYLEVMKRIAEQEPKKLRDIEPKPDAELQALLTKTLAHEPERRYGSAGELADDIGRYLNHEPLVARPPTLSYLLKKRVRKHRLPLSIASAVLILLIGTATWSYISVTRERNAVVAANIEKERQRVEAEKQKADAIAARERERAAKDNAQQSAEATRRQLYFGTIALADATLKDGDHLRARELLDECPADMRGWEWHHLRRVAQDQTATLLVPAMATGTAFNPTGNLLIVAAGQELAAWDANEIPPVRVAKTDCGEALTALAVDMASGRIATAGKGGVIRTYSPYSLKPNNQPIHAPCGEISALALVPGASRVICLATTTGKAWLLDLDQGKPVHAFDSGGEPVLDISVSDDGQYLAAGCKNDKVRVWEVASGKTYRVHSWLQNWGGAQAPGVAFMPGGQSIAYRTGYDSVGVRERDRGLASWTGKVPGDARPGFALSADGSSFAACYRQGVALFNTISGARTRVVQVTRRLAATRPALSHDGRLLAAQTEPGAVRVWSVGLNYHADMTGRLQGGCADALADPQGLRLAYVTNIPIVVGADGIRRELEPSEATGNYNHGLAWSSSGDLLACRCDKGVAIHDVASGELMKVLEGAPPFLIQFADQDRLVLAAQSNGAVAAWDLESGRLLWQLDKRGNDRATSLAVCPGGSEVLIGRWSDGLSRYSIRQGQLLRKEPQLPRDCLLFSPDGKLLYGKQPPDMLMAVDWPSGEIRWHRKSPTVGDDLPALSPDGSRLAVAHYDRTVRICDTADGREVLTLSDCPSKPASVTWAAGGADLLAATPGSGGLVTWHGRNSSAPARQHVEVLPLCNAADSIKGSWTTDNQKLRGETKVRQPCVIQTPLRLTGSYDIEVEVVRLSPAGSFGLILPVGGRQCKLEIGGYEPHGFLTGIDLIDRRSLDQQTSPHKGLQLETGQLYRLRVAVEANSVTAAIRADLNGQRVVDWSGASSRLSMKQTWDTRESDVLGIGGFNGIFEFRRCTVSALDSDFEVVSRASASREEDRRVLGPGQSMDLTELLANPIALRGSCRRSENGGVTLVAPPVRYSNSRIAVPVMIQGGYELTAQFRRTAGEKSVIFILPHPQGQVMAVFDSTYGKCGLGKIRGTAPGEKTYPGPDIGRLLENNRQHTAVLRIEPLVAHEVRISARLDGNELYSWSGPASDLVLYPSWDLPQANMLGLGTTESTAVFDSLQLKMLEGCASYHPPAADRN